MSENNRKCIFVLGILVVFVLYIFSVNFLDKFTELKLSAVTTIFSSYTSDNWIDFSLKRNLYYFQY